MRDSPHSEEDTKCSKLYPAYKQGLTLKEDSVHECGDFCFVSSSLQLSTALNSLHLRHALWTLSSSNFHANLGHQKSPVERGRHRQETVVDSHPLLVGSTHSSSFTCSRFLEAPLFSPSGPLILFFLSLSTSSFVVVFSESFLFSLRMTNVRVTAVFSRELVSAATRCGRGGWWFASDPVARAQRSNSSSSFSVWLLTKILNLNSSGSFFVPGQLEPPCRTEPWKILQVLSRVLPQFFHDNVQCELQCTLIQFGLRGNPSIAR